jgi:cytochrome bd-type quinol oxidase subunit 1
VPVLFSLVGGIISFFILRHDDPKLAKNCLIIGAALTGIALLVMIATGSS